MADLTHFNARGEAHMVDVGEKAHTHRVAVAGGAIRMQPETLQRIIAGGHEKGDVLGIARVAHPIALTRVDLRLEPEVGHDRVACIATVETVGPTGVEMEALCAVQVALLTVYDMCKAVDRGMVIEHVRLLEKRGGRSGHWKADA